MRDVLITPAGAVRCGDRVTLRKGTVVKTMHPARNTYVLARRQTVLVRMILPWAEKPYLTWAGTGGYWCDASAEDVESVEPP